MKRYTIDYGYNQAHLWAPELPADAVLGLFLRLANRCFGMRKSITNEPRVRECVDAGLPPWAPAGSRFALEHNFPLSDRIAWWTSVAKSRDERGDLHPRPAEVPEAQPEPFVEIWPRDARRDQDLVMLGGPLWKMALAALYLSTGRFMPPEAKAGCTFGFCDQPGGLGGGALGQDLVGVGRGRAFQRPAERLVHALQERDVLAHRHLPILIGPS